MKSHSVLAICLLTLITSVIGFSQTVAERLGYPADAKLLILHIDDIGVAHSENAATIKALKEGVANSTSIMVPCPWFMEAAGMLTANKSIDVGLHLVMTAEWKNYKWGPIAPKYRVPSLINKQGYFYPAVDSFVSKARILEVEQEARAQMKRALDFGLDITHIDTHMGSMGASKQLVDLYLRLGKEYNLPVMFSNERAAVFGRYKYEINCETIAGASPEHYPDRMVEYYDDYIKNLKPGLNVLLFHVAYDEAEMQAVTVDHPLWGAKWRQTDYDYLMNPKTKAWIEANNVKLVTWREIRDKIVRAGK